MQEKDVHRDADRDSDSLRYQLLGPSLIKAGQSRVDQTKVSEIIYNASRGSKFFDREVVRDMNLTHKIEKLVKRKRHLENSQLLTGARSTDRIINELERSRDLTQYVVHMDCDAFYAAVEQLDKPELATLPFAVGSGVLTTCNYIARQYGCRSAMAAFVAKQLCPDLVIIKPNYPEYAAKAREVRDILDAYDPHYESTSIDEAYLNITHFCHDHDVSPAQAVEQMRSEILLKTKITVSAGIAANTKLAKICSNINKPNGQYSLPNNRNAIMSFMRNLPTRNVNGIGRVLERELLSIDVKTCGDIYHQRNFLRQLFGEKISTFLLTTYLGLGRTQVQPVRDFERRSVGTESTFRELSDGLSLRQKLRSMAERLEQNLKRVKCEGRTLCLKVKLHTYEVLTRQQGMPKATNLANDLYEIALPMLIKLEHDRPRLTLRLIGLRCSNLISTKNPDANALCGRLTQPKNLDIDPLASDSGSVETAVSVTHGSGARDQFLTEVQGGNGTESEMDGKQSESLNPAVYEKLGACNGLQPEVEGSPGPADRWDCPICFRPQPSDERYFNEHIDLCISRPAIRDAVRESMSEVGRENLSTGLNSKGPGRKRRRLPTLVQKTEKPFFG